MTDLFASYAPSEETILFGHDPTPGIVAAEPDFETGIWIYTRDGSSVSRRRLASRPWILLADRPGSLGPDAEITELEGEGYRWLAEFPAQSAYLDARARIRDEHRDHLTYAGGPKMALMRSGQTLFKGMTFNGAVRMQIDIETDGLDPQPEGNRILLIAVADNRGLVDLIEGDEREILERLVALIGERDPDVIEGHNVLGFDLPFIVTRAARHGVRLPLGRDGSEPRRGLERNYAVGGNSRPFVPIYVHGRHVLDTYLVVQRFDWARGQLSSYGLKECARTFGFAESNRVELPGAEIARIYRQDAPLVREYARQDVVETQRLAELVMPVEFYQTQMVPDAYGQVATTGAGEKINSLLVRAYLAAGRAIARPQAPRSFAGGYTEVRRTGVLDCVVKADVESLYPSLMLTHRIAPQTDSLRVFLPALKALTDRRLEAKRKAAELRDDPGAFHFWDGLQGSFKVLINSFYGYLGAPFCWNDYAAAERVTELGRELVQEIAARIEQAEGLVVEVDTDGVYFVPPQTCRGEEAEKEFVARIAAALPEGLRLAFDGRFAKMLSLKTKNYVLLRYDGRRIFKGASLRSRADERYGRRFLEEAVDRLLDRDLQGVAELYARLIEDLLQKRIPISDLARRERITENTFQSAQKKRMADAVRGAKIGDYVMVYERADGAIGRLDDYAHDENTRHYMDKLYKFARRLNEAFDGAFDAYIPRPTARGLEKSTQETLDLFG
jgi:DNA polymerase elongation subunit (family B)